MTFSDQSAISAHYHRAHAQSSRRGRKEHPDARHECDVCGRKFTEKGSLKKHMSIVHGVGEAKTFRCDVCNNYVAKQKCNLKMHLLHVHGLGDVQTAQCDVCSKVMHS